MKKISDLVVNKPKLIVIISLLLLIPSLISYIFTNVNYDILSYLPSRVKIFLKRILAAAQ